MPVATEEARRRGDHLVSPDHFALALARPHGVADALLADLGIDPLVWRDEINTVLGWREGASVERENRPAGSLADSPVDRRFCGVVAVGPSASHVLRLARREAVDNCCNVGPGILLASLSGYAGEDGNIWYTPQ